MTVERWTMTATTTVTFRRSETTAYEVVTHNIPSAYVDATEADARLVALRAVNALADILTRPVNRD